jgi:hypothetical protein
MGGGVADATGVPDLPETQPDAAPAEAESAQAETPASVEAISAAPDPADEPFFAREEAAGD